MKEFANDPFLWFRMVAAEDRSRVEDQARRILAGEDPPPIEHRIVRKNGSFYILFFTGIAFSLFTLFRKQRTNALARPEFSSRTWFHLSCSVLSFMVIVVAATFFIVNILPTNAFNPVDDLLLYLPRTFQMLQTGTLGGNPFECLGIDSLGSQSFLQAFVLTVFPIVYVNGFDFIFCSILASFLLVGIAKKTKTNAFYLLISIVTMIFINPQAVNVSSLYSGTTIILGMIIASTLLTDYNVGIDIKSVMPGVLPLAFFVAALISLKTTFVLFTTVYLFLYFSILLLCSENKKNVLIRGGFLAILVVLFLLPWVTLYWKNYWQALQSIFYRNIQYNFGSTNSVLRTDGVRALFSPDKLFYGGSFFSYGLVILMLLIAIILSAYLIKKKEILFLRPHLIAVFASAGAGITSYLFNIQFIDVETAVRYSCPIFIATLPYSALIFGSHFNCFRLATAGEKPKFITGQYIRTSVLVILLLILFGFFCDSLLNRGIRAYQEKTILSFPLPPNYTQFTKSILKNEIREYVQNIQNTTIEGTTILAHMSLPFHLDFKRNRVFVLGEQGLFNPWFNIPITYNSEDFRRFLKDQGIRYVIWQYKGMKSDEEFRSYLKTDLPVYQRMGFYNLYLRKMLFDLLAIGLHNHGSNSVEILYNDGVIAVIDLK